MELKTVHGNMMCRGGWFEADADTVWCLCGWRMDDGFRARFRVDHGFIKVARMCGQVALKLGHLKLLLKLDASDIRNMNSMTRMYWKKRRAKEAQND